MPADELPRPADRSWWLEEALALPEFAGPEAPALQGDTSADVVILGGGYTGMWTAWFLKEAEPDLDVVLLEQDICGGGPSGRNGGFLNGMYEDLGMLLERFGPEGRRTVEAAARSIEEIGAWCEANGVDAHYGLHGDLAISTAPAFDRQIAEMIEEAEANGVGHLYRELSAEEVRERFDSPVARIGATMSHTAGVQPARLARGLRRALIERGVRIFEQTPVTRLGVRTAIAETPGGTVRAGHAVLGLNAWSGAIAPLRRSLMVRGTYIVASAPAPERLEQMRWTGGEGVYDLRTAKQAGKATTGHALPPPNPEGPFPLNLFMEPGKATLEEMIASTERGLLVTRFHYSNIVHPVESTITGMTRDGTFWIEGGEVAYPVKNFRFTQSIIEALTNTESIGRDTELASEFFFSASRVPALKIASFKFSGRSDH